MNTALPDKKPGGNPGGKKIVFVLPALTAGGAERVMITLMNGLDPALFSPSLVVVRDRRDLEHLISPAIPYEILGEENPFRAFLALYRALRRQNPDFVVSTMAHMNFMTLLLKPFFPSVKFVVREAITPSFILDRHRRLAWGLKNAYRLLYPCADLVLSPARAIVREFRYDLGMSCRNHRILHNPVDIQHIRGHAGQPLPDYPGRENTVRFVAAGRLHGQKGFDRLIRALPALDMPYEWRLDIWGQGTERDALQTLIEREGLEDKVRLMGHAREPWPHYAAADCFVMPSRWEGLPNAALESLSCGTPVIATAQSGGIDEIRRHAQAGSVRVVRDMEAFIAAMAAVQPDPAVFFRPSLLPGRFGKEAVTRKFEKKLLSLPPP